MAIEPLTANTISATVLHQNFKLAFRRTIFISKSLLVVDEEENSTWYLTRRDRKDIWLENREKKQTKY